jgi:hypothetical protein
MQGEDKIIRRLSELRATQPADATLRNLISTLQAKLELSARLPVLVFEAEEDGDHDCARLFRSLVVSEKQQIAALLEGLKKHLDAQSQQQPPAAASVGPPSPPA